MGKTFDKCKKHNHISSQCRPSPKSDTVVAPVVQEKLRGCQHHRLHHRSPRCLQGRAAATGLGHAGYLPTPSNMNDLTPVMDAFRDHGPVLELGAAPQSKYSSRLIGQPLPTCRSPCPGCLRAITRATLATVTPCLTQVLTGGTKVPLISFTFLHSFK